ncbi:histidine phosphatase family protein [Cohnella candidum]|uniref:histidine phosphatase family protein n=1 Tax=Cohnella candidum TaxID=2674991 RepID=UPI0013DE396D|nr:histidine phosphatase family protein [Cohnella candidum]
MTIYLVRHGETLFNVNDRMQGFSDSPLTDRGIQVAEKLGQGLKNIPFTAVYSSTSERATDTADLILKGRNIPVQTDKRLREINFGSWEGEHGQKIMKEHPDLWTNPESFKAVGGETNAELYARTQAALNDIANANKEKGGNILVVSHGVTILNFALTLDPKSWNPAKQGGLPNASVTKLEWEDGKFKVVSVGDTSYTNP